MDFVLGAGPYLYTEELRMRFDLVGFDPRGIARSTALRCFGNPKQWAGYFVPFAFPITLEQADVWEAADRYLDDACAQRGSQIMGYMSTANVARDMDMLRQAVCNQDLTPFVDFGPSGLQSAAASMRAGITPAIVPEAVCSAIPKGK